MAKCKQMNTMQYARHRAGLTQRQLAALAGVSLTTVQGVEHGNSIGIFCASCIADVLGVSLDDYIGREVPQERNRQYC